MLMTAASRGDSPTPWTYLIMAGADVNEVIKGDGTPMIAAARSGDVEHRQRAPDSMRGLIRVSSCRGDEAPIYHAVVGGHEGMVALLAGCRGRSRVLKFEAMELP